jgi:uncharacterized protein (UPF0332 family)
LDPFEDCLRKGRLKKVEPDQDAIRREIVEAGEELARAKACLGAKRHEDGLVQGYFAMFRSAKALLRSKGYKDTNMYSLLAGLRKLYVEPGDLDPLVIRVLSAAKEQKDLVHEGARCSMEDARAVLASSEAFCDRARALLALPDLPPLLPPSPSPEAQSAQPKDPRRGAERQPKDRSAGGRSDRSRRGPSPPPSGPRRKSDGTHPFQSRETRPKKRP